MKLLHVDWKDVYDGLKSIEAWLKDTDFAPKIIVGVARGGWVPACLLADFLGIQDLRSVYIQTYAPGSTVPAEQAQVNLTRSVEVLDVRNELILVVDDIIDTGKTLEGINAFMAHQHAAKYRVATLMSKRLNKEEYVHAAKMVDAQTWVIFPWDATEHSKLNATGEGIDEDVPPPQ